MLLVSMLLEIVVILDLAFSLYYRILFFIMYKCLTSKSIPVEEKRIF